MAANSAVVGILRAMLTADTAQFDTGMRKAGDTLKLVERNIAKTGTEVAKLTPQAERMVKAFSGDKLLYSANNLVTAITKIGGATKLTEAEQAKANRTLTDAIAKYAALGQVAPKAMVDLERATRSATKATNEMAAGMSAAGRQSASSMAMIAGMSQSGRQAMSVADVATSRASGSFLMASSSASVMSGVVQGLSRNLGAYVGVAALGGSIVKTIEYAGALQKAAVALGATGAATQRLENIAVGSNTTLQAMTGAITAMQDRLAGGDTSAINALRQLGLTVEQVFALNPDQQFMLIAKALKEIHSTEQQIQLGKDIFGLRTVEIIGAVRGEVDQLANSVRVLSKTELEQLQAAENAWNRLGLAAKRYSGLLLSDLMNPFGSHAARVGPFAPVAAPDLPRAPQLATQPGLRPTIVTDAEIRAIDEQLRKLQQQREQAAAIADALFGRDVIQRATALSNALGPIGNIARVSAEKQRELHESVTNAIAVYERMGLVVPERLRVIAEATTTLLVNTTDANGAMRDSIALYEAMPAAITSAAASMNRFIPAVHGVAGAFEHAARKKAELDELMEGGFLSAPPAIVNEDVAGELRQAASMRLQERMEAQRDQMVAFWRHQAGALESASLGRLGSLFFGQFGHDVTGELKAAADEAELDFLRIQRSGKATAEELSTAFTRWREAEARANFTFGERWKQWMGGLKQTFVGILDDMLQYFVRNFIGGLVKGMSGAKIAQGLGNFLAGGTAGAALGGGASFAASSVAGVEAAALGGGGTAAGVGAGIGLGTTLAITGGAAGAAILAWAIYKKGLFRGGEEALKVSPRRDQFFGQLQARFGGSQFEAAAKAFSAAKVSGDIAQLLIAAIYRADNTKAYDAAQGSAISALTAGGLKGIKSFKMGGFVAPGVVQPAILHGGTFGEDITPRTGPASGQPLTVSQHYTVNINTQALNKEGFAQTFKDDIIPALQWEFRLNQLGTVTVLEKALAR